MPTGAVLVSSPKLFLENLVLSFALAIAIRRLPQTSTPASAALAAFALVLAKEIAEVFIERGTGALSDVGAGLIGAGVGYFCWHTQPNRAKKH